MGLEQVIDRWRDKILPLVGEADRQFAGRQFRLLQRQVDDLAPDILGDTVPDTIWPAGTILQRLGSTDEVAIVPTIKRGPRDAEPLQRLADRQMRLLDQPDDHGFVRWGVSHASSPPSPVMLFFRRWFSRVRSDHPLAGRDATVARITIFPC
jgi:hypothetical protein